MASKKLFMISVIDEEGSLNRKYTETVLWLLNNHSDFSKEYVVKLHSTTYETDLYKSLDEAIQKEIYEGYIVLLDCLDEKKGLFNPNVMFEFGGIKNLDKPFVVMAVHEDASKFPFDVKNLNIGFIPELIKKYIIMSYEGTLEKEVRLWFNQLEEKEQTIILDFFSEQYNKFRKLLKKKEKEAKAKDDMNAILLQLTDSHKELKDEIQKITNFVSNTAEYIDGEAAAFSALSEAVGKARYSLRTSRFANQSIVKEPTREQEAFMDALYDASKELKEQAVRIICNNNPSKWQDIYNILFYGGNGSRVYVRKADFSIHFEMVVIDEMVTFIHFYQQVHANALRRGADNQQIEKLNSTLKIQGSSICQKFARIYDRLHHRDVEDGLLCDPSRTLLGINIDNYDNNSEDGQKRLGYFVIDTEKSVSISVRHKMIMNMFKEAFETWELGSRDKVNMVAGIALLETNNYYIRDMMEKGFLTKEEYELATHLFETNNRGDEA